MSENLRCSFCGEAGAVAAWNGSKVIRTCYSCAIKGGLPRLLASTICQTKPGRQDFERDVDQFLLEFYRAAALQLVQKRSRRKA